VQLYKYRNGEGTEIQQTLEMLKAMREEADADRIADREFMKQMMAKMGSRGEKIRAETETIRAETKSIQTKTKTMRDNGMEAKMDANQVEISARMDVNTKRRRRRSTTTTTTK
jgi:hypothetical protein